MSKCGVYKIQSIAKPSFCYIGSSTDLDTRINYHISRLIHGNHTNKKIQSHYDKYGEDDLFYTVLLECDREDLIKTEQFFIDAYNPRFNSNKAGKTHASNPLSISKRRIFLSKRDKTNLKELQAKYERLGCNKKMSEIASDAARIGINELLK